MNQKPNIKEARDGLHDLARAYETAATTLQSAGVQGDELRQLIERVGTPESRRVAEAMDACDTARNILSHKASTAAAVLSETAPRLAKDVADLLWRDARDAAVGEDPPEE